ncbi:MAG: magnesium chelatase subunit D [Acetobacteraceae bacterium]|nr:magnesium chelatase subunit D [Acetobacteraceae bacterium]
MNAPAPATLPRGAEAASTPAPDQDAALAAALFAIAPVALGGVRLRAPPGPARDAWLALLKRLLPGAPLRRIPPTLPDDRLLGGLDLAATLAAGRPVAERGVLAETDGGVLLLAMAERLPPGTAARIAAALDRGEAQTAAGAVPARIGVVALDEGLEDEAPPAALLDRLAFALFEPPPPAVAPDPARIAAARARLPAVTIPDAVIEALCATAAALGVASLRAPWLALQAARAAAALDARDVVTDADAILAARLVLAPRATRLPAPPEEDQPPPDEPPPDSEEQPRPDPGTLQDLVLEAAKAAIPRGLLAALAAGRLRATAAATGKAGAERQALQRGRPIGARPGALGGGARLALLETLRAAAPWQRLRPKGPGRIAIRRQDFRIRRFKHHAETTTIFAVDASGSAALARLAEAKGAVELLLAECYVRRDRVALIAFRGTKAELLLPPTHSLVRAKRSLAALPGGGGTPLASGIEAAHLLAGQERRAGRTPLVVLLTDGRANIARDGAPGRPQAEADALAAARLLGAAGIGLLLVDTSPRPSPFAQTLAREAGGRYLALPQPGSGALQRAVQEAAGG